MDVCSNKTMSTHIVKHVVSQTCAEALVGIEKFPSVNIHLLLSVFPGND